MLTFDKENKITFEQLSFSLQDKLRRAVSRAEMDQLENTVSIYEKCLNGVRFSIVNSTSEVKNPINNKEVAIVNVGGVFFLYIYSNNKWNRIPKDDVFYRMNIVQTDHQLITLTSGGKKYTTPVNLKYSATWTADIKSTSMYYKAGNLTATSGKISGNDTLAATPATIIYNFITNVTIAKHNTRDAYGIRINYNNAPPSDDFYGSISDPKLLDAFYVRKNSETSYSSAINFWDSPKLMPEYKRLTITLTYNNESYNILQNCDTSIFNETGDLANYPPFTNDYYYELLRSLKGKQVKLYIHFESE